MKPADSNPNPMFWTLHPKQQLWHYTVMPKPIKHERRPKDVNQLAHYLGAASTQENSGSIPPPTKEQISQLMSHLGRKGGKIGGKRRLETMTLTERQEVARKAASARWGKNRKKSP